MGVVVSTSTLTDRLNAVRDLFGEVIAELEHAVGLMPPAEILDAADGVEAISRQAGYAQLLAAKSIEDQVFADLQQRKRSEFRNCAEFLQSRLRIRRSEARRRFFSAALKDMGFALNVFSPTPGSKSWRTQGEELAEWLVSLPKPCGVWAAFDQRAKHVLDACRLAGLNVPSQIQVLGVDNETYVCSQT